MAYEVTATRKRPQAFDTMVGQDFVVSTLSHAIEQHRIAHAYLFSGPRGVGKTTSARILAKALNCEHGPTAHPCGTCASCREITAGNSPDVIEIDGASNTSVNDIRAIKDEVMFPPQASRYKIYIIDEVHMLSNSAFNALLKTIEEPPDYIIFIFATTELQKVPATIRSRCQQFHFQLIGLNQIKAKLKEAADDLKVQADDDALFWIAKESTGSMRDAYTLFDQVASFSGDHITLAGIKEKLGLVGSDQLNELALDLLHGDRKGALLVVQSLLQGGISVDQCVKDLTQYYRTLFLLAQGITDEDILGVVPSSIDQEVQKAYTNEQLEQAIDLLLKLYRDIRYSVNPRFELELAVSRLGDLAFMVSPTTLVQRLDALQQSLTGGKQLPAFARVARPQPAPAPRPVRQAAEPAVAPAPQVQEAPVAPHALSKADLPALQQAVGGLTGALLNEVTAIDQTDRSVVFHFTKTFTRDKAHADLARLKAAVAKVCGWQGAVELVVDAPKTETAPSSSQVVGKVASLFRGHVAAPATRN